MSPPINSQIGPNQPIPDRLDVSTNPIYPPQTLDFRLRGFVPEVYTVDPQSHIYRLLGVLLGDAGGEQARKRALVDRLRTSLSSTNFVDLDAFWGSIFKLNRTQSEILPVNPSTGRTLDPYSDSATLDLWNQAHAADASFRDRIRQFGQALQYGCSPVGIRGVAEAILGCQVDLYEDFSRVDPTTGLPDVYTATLVPYRPLSNSEVFNLKTILDQVKPAAARIKIQATPGSQSPTTVVPILQAWASSSYWQVLSTITPGPYSLFQDTTVRPSFPYSQYQGESWCLNDAIVNVTGELWDQYGLVKATDYFEHYVWPDGTFTNFSPDLAVQPQWEVDLGRLASSGVLSSNPLNNSGGLSPLLLDGMDPVALRAVLASLGISFQTTNHDFWSSPPRLPDDGSIEVLTFSLDQLHYVDSISFEVANFPHQVTLQIENPSGGGWINVLTQTIGTSDPEVLTDPTSFLFAHEHPQHSDEKSWIKMGTRFVPFKMQNLRLLLNRVPLRSPLNVDGTVAPYSLGVRNMNLQMVIDSHDLLPVGGGPIDTVTNVIKDQVAYSVYEEDPNGPVNQTGQWRCSPQVSASAVVNYYVDTRSSIFYQGATVDGFYIEPTHQGVHCNLYYAMADDLAVTQGGLPSGGKAVDTPLQATSSGSVMPTPQGLKFDSTLGSHVTLPTIDYHGSIYPTFWAGISFIISDVAGPFTVCKIFSASVVVDTVAGTVTLVDDYAGTTAEIDGLTFSTGVTYNLMLGFEGYDPDGVGFMQGQGPGFFLGINGQTATYQGGSPVAVTHYVTVGDPAGNAGFTLLQFVLKEEILTQATASSFMVNPKPYCTKGTFYAQDNLGLTDNAYVRFDPALVSDVNPLGFVGGTPDFMALLDWKPVASDFILTKGQMRFKKRAARFWKFEMTNLVAEPFSVYLPQVPVETQMMSPSAVPSGQGTSFYQGAVPPGTTTQISQVIGDPVLSRSSTYGFTVPDQRSVSPTTTLVSSDPAQSVAMTGNYLNFGYQAWTQGSDAPVEPLGGPESYHSVQTSPVQQVAYFCGFKTVLATVSNPEAAVDTDLYRENFYDNYPGTSPTALPAGWPQ